ncbi:MAG: hypothetical protein MZV63_04320 [Marinilabiliales bacterium]|nr:hypothetical protein [Marinilabiliales bacterium]
MDDIACGGSMEAYANDTYQCFLRELPNGIRYLSIKRNDRFPIRNWQHLQQIKNDICGVESEGVELFPAMSRIADAANQYHIWVLPEGEKFPLGFEDRVSQHESNKIGRQVDMKKCPSKNIIETVTVKFTGTDFHCHCF